MGNFDKAYEHYYTNKDSALYYFNKIKKLAIKYNEIEYKNFEQALGFVFNQQFKKLYTCLPGIVQFYDETTKRAQVLPAIQRTFTDGSSISMPILVDVPIIFPSGGGFTITMPITNGDSVLIMFSQRGITEFKKYFDESLPDIDSLLSIQDAIAIPGFGALSISPNLSDGANMQTEDGTNSVSVNNNKVELKLGANTLDIDNTAMTATIGGATLVLNATSLTSSVPVFAPSYSGLSGGAANMVSGIDMNTQDIDNVGALNTTGGVNISTHIHTGDSGGNTGTPKN